MLGSLMAVAAHVEADPRDRINAAEIGLTHIDRQRALDSIPEVELGGDE
jgi:hypothetical protein